ncbi:MAG: ABC transporter permease, partial [Bacteroidota bacterium]
MRPRNVYLFLEHTFAELMKRPGTKLIIVLLNAMMVAALLTAFENLREQRATVENYRQEVRERWESNPDKHPHRMAHYGYVAFRQPYPLSFFDAGVDSYVGTAVFLEAHRQNTVNFSAASLSTGLLRFGELTGALVLQVLLPLLLFFWGFPVVAGEREDGKLRLVFAQGVTWAELIIGKAMGLFCASLTVLLPAILLTGIFLAFYLSPEELLPTYSRYGLLALSYGVYLFAVALLTVWVSAISKTAKVALLRLIGCWLLFVLVLPKVSQVVGQVVYPSPSKVAFDRAVEED